MFGEEFYPTPMPLAKKMIQPYLKKVKTRENGRIYTELEISGRMILEPSAGKGDILDGIQNDTVPYRNEDGTINKKPKTDGISLKNCKVYCIEQNKDLQTILQEKGYRVIADDFLDYSGDYFFDLILMNPPFSNGDEHLLKAWDILEEGDIVCILNAETIRNSYSEKRKLLQKIIEDHGSYEFLQFEFSNAERKTDVEIALVRLHKVAKVKSLNFEFEQGQKEKSFVIDEATINDAPAFKDVIGNMLIQYDKVKESFVEFLRLYESLRFYGDPLVKKRVDSINQEQPAIDIVALATHAIDNTETKKEAYNDFCDSIKEEMWGVVFQNISQISSLDLEKLMTHSIRKKWDDFIKAQGSMDFTKKNVWSVIEMLFNNRNQILEQAIVDVFDIFTSYYDGNRKYIEGWKTNNSWKVNRKIILPNWLRMSWEKPSDRIRFGAEYRHSYSRSSEYSDIDKAMCYICGDDYNKIDRIYDSMEQKFNEIGKVYKGPHTATCESTYFYIKFFMKGTIHLEFKDAKLWEEFNLRACAGKNWLPENELKEWQKRKEKKTKNSSSAQKQLLLS
jgi:hypothetical protein